MALIAAKSKGTLDRNNTEERTLKTYRRLRRPTLPDELVYEILLRLPVKTLARSRSVCKAWRAIISDPSFIHTHLKHSASRHERESPSFLITPHTLSSVIDDEVWPSTFSNNVPFYHWQDGQDNACLVHETDFHGEFGSVYRMSHCDGLVMLPTDTKIYVFNPATGDVLKLPDGQKSSHGFQTAGIGLDLGTSTYKVVCSFYRSVDFYKRTYSAGMEVFTLGGHDSCWRTVEDPPYPVASQVPLYLKGSLYWHMCKGLLESPPEGFLRFDLEDETFSFIWHPVLPSDQNRLDFVELGGELCLAQYVSTQMVIWKSLCGENHQWDRLYVINLPEAWKFRPFDFRSDCILLRRGNHVYRYDEASRTAKEGVCVDQLRYKNPRAGDFDFVGEDFYYFNIIPYTESLVPLTRRDDMLALRPLH